MILTVQDLLRQDARIQDLYFNISEMKLSITSLYTISDATKYDIIWTENSNVNVNAVRSIGQVDELDGEHISKYSKPFFFYLITSIYH